MITIPFNIFATIYAFLSGTFMISLILYSSAYDYVPAKTCIRDGMIITSIIILLIDTIGKFISVIGNYVQIV